MTDEFRDIDHLMVHVADSETIVQEDEVLFGPQPFVRGPRELRGNLRPPGIRQFLVFLLIF